MTMPDHTGEVEEALVEARPTDPAGLALARARVETALFGAAAGCGRFHVLERLGRGGMGSSCARSCDSPRTRRVVA